MTLTRRHAAALVFSLALVACGRTSAPSQSAASPGLPADLRPIPNAAYDAWVAAFRQRAIEREVAPATLTAAFQGTGYLPGVVTRDRNQTETSRTLEDYLSIVASDDRVATGRRAFQARRGLFDTLEARYGVDAEIIAAIWGVESAYGTRRGQVPVISATSTLAFDGRRGRLFEQQLMAALEILQNGDIAASAMTGSWAGAMGHTQFIPTSYQAFAVDFTGDGRRDIWSDDPSDALASAAAYLQRNGWARGLSWGGVAGSGAASGPVLQPQRGGPGFNITRNFSVIKRYNNSDLYAIGVGHLADRIGGAGPLWDRFPPDANGLTRADRIELQTRLTAAGFDTGGADGVVGRRTEAAIRAFEARQGLPITGTPSRALLDRLA